MLCFHTGPRAWPRTTRLSRLERDAAELVVLDLLLPGTDGFEVLLHLWDRGDNAPVVVLTARDEAVGKIIGPELGADDYLVKPFDPRGHNPLGNIII